VIAATLALIAIALYDHWQEVRQLQLQANSWFSIVTALVINLLAHIWLGMVWGRILTLLQYSTSPVWSSTTFVTNEIAKYLPGNIWQIYGRVRSAHQVGIPIEVGIVSILLESMTLATVALGFALVIVPEHHYKILSGLGLGVLLVGLHPLVFNAGFNQVHKILTNRQLQQIITPLTHQHGPALFTVRFQGYPTSVLLGTFLALSLRSISFLLVVTVFTPISFPQLIPLVGGFIMAWTLGIITPGISGGVGLFEAIALTLLDNAIPPSLVLGAVILYRLINVVTEITGATLGWLTKLYRRDLSL
jgi:glycosyltransferase 2 family protein